MISVDSLLDTVILLSVSCLLGDEVVAGPKMLIDASFIL